MSAYDAHRRIAGHDVIASGDDLAVVGVFVLPVHVPLGVVGVIGAHGVFFVERPPAVQCLCHVHDQRLTGLFDVAEDGLEDRVVDLDELSVGSL